MCTACNHDFSNLSAGNPNLHAQHAWNYDLLYANYFTPVSVFSAGVFYKQISDFIYSREFVYNGPVTQFDGYYGTQPENGGTATIAGLEMDYSDRLRFLTGPMSGLGFDVNWTHVDSKGHILADTASSAARTGQAHRGADGAAAADGAQRGQRRPDVRQRQAVGAGRLAVPGRQHRRLRRRLGAPPTATTISTPTRRSMRPIIYNVTRSVQVQLQGLDLNDAVFGFYNGTPSHRYAVQREFYGRTIILGTKIGF